MNYETRNNKAFIPLEINNFNGAGKRFLTGFTLIELLVAIGILAIVMSFVSVIFKVSIGAHRTAIANAEIMQKLRAITNQLNTDFKGLRKDGEIFVVWVAKPLTTTDYKDNDLDGYERFDRIMFFADGDFQSYKVNPAVRGNVARICYMIARNGNSRAEVQDRTERVLARSLHILTADSSLADFPDPNSLSDTQWYDWNNRYEYDKISLEAWKKIPWDDKINILSATTDIQVEDSSVNMAVRGVEVDPTDANSIHMLLCEGVGEFKIQGWYDALQQWIPEVDPDGDGDLADTHFFLNDPNEAPGVLYPAPNGRVRIYDNDDNDFGYPRDQIDEAHFNAIPGLGRALKFTFTLYDSRGIIENGMTFTHVVYLDK
ncbi:MAG: type II secretion system protein [Planctomycetes bacterium]|nr:type II secretion system protein [Planctomycetota bacterium]